MDINGADFSPDAHFVIVIDVTHSVPHEMGSATMIYDQGLLRGIEIVDALTSATTTPGDLHAAAIAWFPPTTSNAKLLRMVHLEPCTTNSPSV
jgi:hypothetical protein